MKKIILIITLFVITIPAFAQEIVGTWSGNLEVQAGRKVAFIFQISQTEGGLKSTIAIPSQGVKDLVSKATSFENTKLIIDASNLGFRYTGEWNELSGTIDGTFREGVNEVPLVLAKETIQEVKLNRPQEPSKPYPYQKESITFENKKHGLTLAGTLTLPIASDKNTPVVILISGSGPQDRDQSFAGHKSFLVLADYLTRNGIGVLRHDDRGFGESTGNFATATTADFAEDVLSAVNYLKKRKDINIHNIGLIGHSEGAIIAPMVANRSKDVGFIIMLAGTGIPGKDVSLTQAIDYRSFAVTDEKQYEAYVKEAIEIASSKKDIDIVKQELSTFYHQSEVLASILPANVNKNEFIENLVSTRTSPWIRYFYHYNPSDEIRKINIPALALYGSNDTQVPPKHHLQPVKEALTLSKSKRHEVVLLEGLNHLFQESKTGQMQEYSQIEQTFAPKALEAIVAWINEQTQ